MNRLTYILLSFILSGIIIQPALAEPPIFMSNEWAQQMCQVWSQDKVFTQELQESGWITNDKGRGYKVIQLYRNDCAQDSWVELKLQSVGSKATCTYGGAVTQKPDTSADYIMNAETRRWNEMGQGEYGPMWAMMTGRLKFEGPMWEAMKNMGPFKSFLLFIGKVPSNMSKCNK